MVQGEGSTLGCYATRARDFAIQVAPLAAGRRPRLATLRDRVLVLVIRTGADGDATIDTARYERDFCVSRIAKLRRLGTAELPARTSRS
jgi:hypothetical protein